MPCESSSSLPPLRNPNPAMRWSSALLSDLFLPDPRLAVTCLQGYLRHTRFLRPKTSDSAVPAWKLYAPTYVVASPVEKHQDSA
ncbi:hypothetical protein CPAR01_08317 [Colletotrichum paranaense]|uniref:Uncharacterized protein n=1 Tax=Colletotrichum paranaense TaxID=1914294 RepID=A0ABQ9SJX5_9PEZI|nr:uncharacterized protein CPAR01_08317 [Colletotrichum paranaense]KAK1538204.1 hypothetical protein CPAR01_08317 [Colletotrichum paranaense]